MTVNALDLAYLSHVGLVRSGNEDSFMAYEDVAIVAIADGMGGHRAGDVASKIAVEVSVGELIPAQKLDQADGMESLMRVGQAVESANSAIFETAKNSKELLGMGTTIVVSIFRESRIYYAHVGDSRLYRLRDGKLQCLTRDHSLIQDVLEAGIFANRKEAMAAGVGENVLTRSLGLRLEVDVDVSEQYVEPGDLFLYCSDGLSTYVKDAEISKILTHKKSDLHTMTDQLVNAALAAGGHDNVTVILARPRS